ncbi:MAG: hypothetical protein PVJ01_00840 [Pseudomonadota bacterium]|jgi:hypothetical protein
MRAVQYDDVHDQTGVTASIIENVITTMELGTWNPELRGKSV